MTDYGDLIQSSFGRANPALPITVGNIDEDPERAQRALDLAKVTGVPSSAIYGDLDEFERNHKALVASDIVANNPHLGDWVQSNPMAPKVANDDYGNLDAVSQKVTALKLPSQRLVEAAFPGDPLKRFKDGGPLGSWLTDEDLKNHPVASAVLAGLGTPVELLLRGISGTVETAADVASNLATAAGAPGLGRELGGVIEAEAMGLTGRQGLHPPPPYARIRPYLENGREPPPTVLPEYDAYRAKQNADDVQALKEATADAQSSLTRERSPDLFRQFISQHTDAEIAVGGDAAVALYGDKPPTPDDGLLGWVPDIESKLALAKASGDDISIPLADWLTHVDPKVMDVLHDDLRVRPNGITAREAQLSAEADAARPPSAPIPEEVPTVRAASALEPMFSIGDRKLQLNRMAQDPGTRFGVAQGFHDFHLLDENGQPVAALNISEQKGGKQLYVDGITGVNGLGPRDFGPALMRDLLRQIKAEFPNAESISGHRVSGAREKAGKEMTMPEAVVKLDNPKGWETAGGLDNFRAALEGGQWETYSPEVQAYVKPYAEFAERDRQLIEAINDELDRIVPRKVSVGGVERITAEGIRGQRPGEAIEPTGIYIRYNQAYPVILYALEGPNPLYSARHEAIHHLRQYGFFNNLEWSTLERAANEEDWMNRFNIHERYPKGDLPLKLEETIAEAYPAWKSGQLQVRPEVQTIFEKMKAFFDALVDRIGKILGKPPTWEDIFKRIDTGEVGRRDSIARDPGTYDPMLSAPEDPSRVFERAAALGMTVEQFKAYDKLIAKRHEEDIAKATERAQKQQAREQTKEWKANRADLRKEVADSIRNRPDVATDLFLAGDGLYGRQTKQAYKLDADLLTEKQKAMLPPTYFAKGGLAPDDVANMFGYGSGDAMVDKLINYNITRRTANMNSRDFVSRVIDVETDRQMRIKYGVLDDNIMDAVKEQVVGETQQNILHEDTLYYGSKIGQLPATRENILDAVKTEFGKTSIGSVRSDRLLALVGRQGRVIEAAHLKQDWETAFRQAQQREYTHAIAKEAIAVESTLAKFDKLAKKYAKAFDPTKKQTIDADWGLFVRDTLSKVDRPYGMSVQGLAKAISESDYANLADFVAKQETQHAISGLQIPVADFLLQDSFHKPFKDLTVDEFKGLNQSVKVLDKLGREIHKIEVAGEKQDRVDWLAKARTQLQNKFAAIKMATVERPGAARTYIAALTNLETLFARFDGRDPRGLFTKFFIYPGMEAGSHKVKLEKEFAGVAADLGKIKDPKKLVDSPFVDPLTGRKLDDFNRSNLEAVISNMGNEYNLRVLTKGWKIDPAVLWKWVEGHTTTEDFDRAQARGKMFDKAKRQSDTVYQNIYGIAPEDIQVRPFTIHGKEYSGWYHPIIYDPARSRLSKLQSPEPGGEKMGSFWPSPSNAYTKRRTGSIDVLDLSMDMIPVKLNQMLHDISFREFVHNTAKITRDNGFRRDITTHYGPEYVEVIDKWLERIAGNASYNSNALSLATRLSNKIRQNVVSTYIAFGATTIMKHGPTAAVMSAKELGSASKFARITAEVGWNSFRNAVQDLFGRDPDLGDSLHKFIHNNSEEIQQRDRNFLNTIMGQHDIMVGNSTLRNTIAQYGAKGVAFSDLISAEPLWLAAYRDAFAENPDAGEATYIANRAVRRAHGSTSIVNQPMIVSNTGPLAPWLTSIYGFFGTNMQRRLEIAHDLNDAYKLGRQGEIATAMKSAPQIMSSIFTYVIWPGIVEEVVTGQFTDDKRGWGTHALTFALGTAASTFIGLRDMVYGLTHGRDPQVGLLGSPLDDVKRLVGDATKHHPVDKANAGKLVQDAITVFGDATGMGPKHVGTAIRYGMDVYNDVQRPKTAGDVWRGTISGVQKKHLEK